MPVVSAPDPTADEIVSDVEPLAVASDNDVFDLMLASYQSSDEEQRQLSAPPPETPPPAETRVETPAEMLPAPDPARLETPAGTPDPAPPPAAAKAAAAAPYAIEKLADAKLHLLPDSKAGERAQSPEQFATAEAAKSPRATGAHRPPPAEPLHHYRFVPWTFCHHPLYFEQVGLERYGNGCGWLAPAASGAHFFATVPALPYALARQCPGSCVAATGYSRCDDCLPRPCEPPLWRGDAALVEAATVVGLIFLIP